MKINLYQIFYNEETKKSRDVGFLLLDNTENQRPDWREYWPIRNYLLNKSLDEDALYGFFSPKFKAKTGLSSDKCFHFINSQPRDIDVVSFSPFYDLGAFFQNSFLQCLEQHRNSRFAIEGALKILAPLQSIDDIVMHSGNNIFCNFFVAKPRFWKAWLENCELIWNECEKNSNPIARELNAVAKGHDSPAAIKTFAIERIASLILATNHSYKIKAYNPFELPFSNAGISKERNALIQMDALKLAYSEQKREEYLKLFKIIADLVQKKLSGNVHN
jgi:hypothetical protein